MVDIIAEKISYCYPGSLEEFKFEGPAFPIKYSAVVPRFVRREPMTFLERIGGRKSNNVTFHFDTNPSEATWQQ